TAKRCTLVLRLTPPGLALAGPGLSDRLLDRRPDSRAPRLSFASSWALRRPASSAAPGIATDSGFLQTKLGNDRLQLLGSQGWTDPGSSLQGDASRRFARTAMAAPLGAGAAEAALGDGVGARSPALEST